MSAASDEFPSTFYNLLEGATEAVLAFPVDGDSMGPFWNEQGELDLVRCEWEQEPVNVVPLGGNRYRLAERCFGPLSSLRLDWGDEFIAINEEDGTLRLTRVVTPAPFAHFSLLISGRFDNSRQLAQHLHSLGGGWETVAGGMLTLTVPVAHASELQRLMNEDVMSPNAFSLEQ